MVKKALWGFIFFLCFASQLFSLHYKWESQNGEPSFELDLPSNWDEHRIVRSNGVLVYFRNQEAMIEVRSFIADDIMDKEAIINAKAARLAARFDNIQLLSAKNSVYRPNMIIAVWKLRKNGVEYTDKSAFLMQDELLVSISCLTRSSVFSKYAIIFDNAIYSLKIHVEDEGRKLDLNKLKKLFVFNRPNSDKAIAPPADVSVTTTQTTTTKKTQKTKKKKTGKKVTDNFLPPVK
ncbi:MAG: hypothetical protein D6767_10580 [Candidatus Hydrogenedentota bacterium]|nr:MAG: hypothetical protein D6767_10580 [Candidatus Hydrogenedentota bacterium]